MLVASLLLLLFMVGALVYLDRSRERDRILMEFAVSRAASLLTEAHLQGVALTERELPRGVVGFGIYDGQGEAEIRLGDAPPALSEVRGLPYSLTLSDETLRLLRPVGRGFADEISPQERRFHRMGPGHRMPMRERGSESRQRQEWNNEGWGHGGPGGMPMMGPSPPNTPEGVERLSYTAYDVSEIQGRSRQLLLFIILALSTTAALFFLLLWIVTRLRRAEEKVQESRRLAELGEAARTLTHEIRNPLGALKMQASLLKRTLPPDQEEATTLLDEEIGRISYLVDRVREFLRNPQGNPEQLELNRFLRGLRLGEDVRREESPSPLWVLIDPEKLRSAVENLVSNGREANRERDEEGGLLLRLSRSGREARIELCDRGPGMSEEVASRIFDPFFTTKSQGTGVGLAISRRFVAAAGGSITFAPREGGGTCFSIVLPLQKEERSEGPTR
jgi:two-component system sensor histidine kinase HydH